jgi:outer membrane protein assembly factor BamE (lipoprotein component of BamABCDE complex)
MRHLLPLLLLLLTPSCFMGEMAINEPLDADRIAQLQPGTTAQQVADLLGAPEQVVELGSGSAWLYQHTSEKNNGVWFLVLGLYGTDRQFDRAWVFFDGAGLVTHYGATLQADQSEYDLPMF